MTCNPIISRVAMFALLAGCLVLQTSPAFAQFTGAGAAATNWFIQLLPPVFGLGVAAAGIFCLAGRIHWFWFLAALAAVALFFGRDQVVAMFRSWVGA